MTGSISQPSLARAFAAIESAAAKGLRCPFVRRKEFPHSPIEEGAIRVLKAAGKIKDRTYGPNFRVVTVLVGPHAGKSTAPPPNPEWRPHPERVPARKIAP